MDKHIIVRGLSHRLYQVLICVLNKNHYFCIRYLKLFFLELEIIKQNKMRMKRFRITTIALIAHALAMLMQNQIYAQNSVSDYKEVLSQNIMELDAIEGLYDVKFKIEAYAPIVGWDGRTENYTAVIRAHPDEDGKYLIFALEGGSKILEGIIEKRGGNGYYKVTRRLANGDRNTSLIQLKDMFYFEVIEQGGVGVAQGRVEWKFVKFFPTEIMYSEALRKHEEEHNKPDKWSGSGFVIQEGYVVTNYHVIEDANSINIQGTTDVFEESVEAQVIATDKDNDLAILKIKGDVPEKPLPYSIKTFTSDVGEDVWVLGYPLTSTMGDEIKLTTGVISSRSGYEGSVSMYQISAPAQPGNSGGPVFDKDGNLIAIICSKHTGAENATYAIKASCLRNLVENSIDHDILPHTNSLSGKELTEKVKEVKGFVFYINCTK